MSVSFRIGHKKVGGHVYVRVFSSEFGPGTTHGLDGTLTMRPQAWDIFRKALELSRYAYAPNDEGRPEFEFVDETGEATA